MNEQMYDKAHITSVIESKLIKSVHSQLQFYNVFRNLGEKIFIFRS